jgi:hypothetical protein
MLIESYMANLARKIERLYSAMVHPGDAKPRTLWDSPGEGKGSQSS